MAKFYGCLKIPDDPTMADSLNEASGSLEVLEANDEIPGKKKSKFKAFKNFFGKKKKKETEDAQGGRRLKSRVSSSNISISSLEAVQAGQQPEPRIKRSMGNKSLSHDSIFMSEPEPTRSASKTCHSPEPQRDKPLQKSDVFKTLPRAGSMYGAISGAMYGVVPRYVPRSGIWVAGSKTTEIPPLRPHQPSTSLPLIQSDTISKEFEEISLYDESPKVPQKKALPQKILTLKKSSFEPSCGPVRSQSLTTFATLVSPSGTQLPIGFSTPATTQGYLDSSVAVHKMVLNPQKQKKKNLQVTVKLKQEEPGLPLVSEKKSTTRPKEADQKKPPRDSAGPSSQEQSNKTEIYDKTTDQAANIDAAGSQGYLWSAAYGRRRGRKGSSTSGKSECGPRGRSSQQSSNELVLGNRAGYPPADKTDREIPFWHLPLEKQVTEQPTAPQAETTIPQEWLSDENYMGRRKAGLDSEARKTSAPHPIPEDRKLSVVSGPSPYHEDGASGARKTGVKATLLPVVESLSTAQEDVTFSVAVEAQVLMGPSNIQLEEEDASSFDSQMVQFKMDSAQHIPTMCKERPPEHVLQAFTASISGMTSALAERGISAGRLPPKSLPGSLGRPEAEGIFSDSESASEEGSGSEQPLAPTHSFQSLGKLKDDQDVLAESKSFVGKLNSSHDQLAPRCAPQPLGETEEEVSTESNPYVEKYNSAEDWSSSEEDLPPRHPSLRLGKRKDQQEVSSVSKDTAEEWGVSVEQIPPSRPSQPFVGMFVPQQVSSGSMSAAAEWGLMPPSHHVQSWVTPESEEQAFAGSASAALEWAISMEPLPPRMTRKRRMRHKVEQQASTGPEISTIEGITSMEQRDSSVPEIATIEGITSMEQRDSSIPEIATIEGITSMELQPPTLHSQPLVKPTADQEISAGPESAAAEGSLSVEPPPPRHPVQPWMRPKVEQKGSSFPESTAVEGSISMEPSKVLAQPLMNPKVEQNVFSGSEGAEKVNPVEPQLPKCSPQSLTNPQAQHIFSENADDDEGLFVELLPPKCSCQHLMRLKFQPQTITHDSASASTERSGSVEPMPPIYAFQLRVSPRFKQASVEPENTAMEWSISMEPLSSTMPSQLLVRPVAEQEVSSGSKSAPAEHSSPVEPVPPTMPSQPLMRPVAEQEVSSGSKSAPAERSGPVEPVPPTMPSQPLMRPVAEQEVSSGSKSAPAGHSGPVEPMPSRPLMKPVAKQPISAGPDSVVTEVDTPTELLPPSHWSIVRHKVQQMSSSSESAVVEGAISGRPQSPKYPSPFLMRSKIQEEFSCLEDIALEEGTFKKSLPPKHPSQSFVKFMAQHIFSESPAFGGPIDVDPLSSNQPSKPLLRPKVKHQARSDWESADIEGGISLKMLPTKCPLQSLGRPEDPQELFSRSKSAPGKWSGYQEQLPPRHLSKALRKLEYQQAVSSVSESSPEEWWFRAEDGAACQPQIFSTGSVSVPAEWVSAEAHLPRRHPFQAFAGPEHQQQVYSNYVSAAAEGIIFESNPSIESLPRGPASNKTRKYSQGSEDPNKNVPAPATKSTITPAWPASTFGDTYSNEEVLESSNQNNSYSNLVSSKDDVENLFGVRLRRIPSLHKCKSEKQGHFAKLPVFFLRPISSSVGREPQIRRSASQEFLDTRENLTTSSDFAEKQQSSPQADSMAKNQPAYEIPGKTPGQQSDSATSEPAWVTMVKERQRNFPARIPMQELDTKNRAGAQAETTESKYGEAEKQLRKIFTSNENRQEKMEQMKLPKSTKAGAVVPVEFDDQKIFQVPAMRKEIRRSSTLPAVLPEPAEPLWFSLAKKKAKAWSLIAEIIQ